MLKFRIVELIRSLETREREYRDTIAVEEEGRIVELDVEYRDSLGRSNLHLAVIHADEDITMGLLQIGADPSQKDNIGKTPFDYADDLSWNDKKRMVDILQGEFEPPFQTTLVETKTLSNREKVIFRIGLWGLI